MGVREQLLGLLKGKLKALPRSQANLRVFFCGDGESSGPDSVRSRGFQVGSVRGDQLPRGSAFPPARGGARLAGAQHLAEDRIPAAPRAGKCRVVDLHVCQRPLC